MRESQPQGSAAWQQAVFGSAVCSHHLTPAERKRVNEAAELYRLLLRTTPQSRFAPRATMNLGRLLELRDYPGDIVDLPGARAMYQQVVDRWPAQPIAGEATLRIAGTYIQTYDESNARRGVELLERRVRDHPDDPLASAMWQYLADTHWVGTVGVLIYLAGLQSISQDVYEAAELDGVGSVGRLFRIELPLILTQVRINLIFMTIGTLTDYGLFLLLLGPHGGPGNVGMVPGLYMYRTAFIDERFGYACALGMVLFIILLATTILYQRYVRVEK